MAQLQSSTKVINFRQASELEKMLDLSLKEEETDLNWSSALELAQQTIDYSVKTGTVSIASEISFSNAQDILTTTNNSSMDKIHTVTWPLSSSTPFTRARECCGGSCSLEYFCDRKT